MRRTTILLADDHGLVCSAFQKLLEPQYDVVGTVGDGRALLKAAASLKPEVVLVDIAMPMLNGLDAGRELKKQMPEIKLIYLTMNSTREVAEEALRAGASAYVLKNARCSELIQAIEGALRGRSYVSPHVRRAMAAALIRNPRSADRQMHLTNRQVEVLQMFAEGLSLKEIADALQISYRTVRFHKFGIMEELGIQTNSELVQYAMKRGMISSV